MDKPKKVKFKTCNYCKQADLLWEQHDGKYVLFESYGLPHQCEVRDALIKEQNETKKGQYKEFKAKIEAIPDGSKCHDCDGSGLQLMIIHMSPSHLDCNTCWGKGIITAQLKRDMLYRKRIEIWPSLRGK